MGWKKDQPKSPKLKGATPTGKLKSERQNRSGRQADAIAKKQAKGKNW